ncbi:MAG: alpha/beta fold hydrolase [Chitinivibrionales bacterium]|nr:alpha/beta fold hydrolase [Chitinivibrionales bacterium]MBD3395178.1 alpha/beta fold hydrolase [Chitinivibrionales bacterium]
MNVLLRLLVLILRIGMLFVPEQKYTERMKHIEGPDEKNSGHDLHGWEYRKVEAPRSGFVHRYYYYPPRTPNAPVFLFFHGLNLDGRTFLHLKGLADKWELIAYDLPEETDRYTGDFEDFMMIVEEFVDVMDIKRCCVCGVSFGGSIALRLAASHPEIEAQRLVLASTAIVGTSPGEKRERRRMARWVGRQPDYKLYWFMEKVFERQARQYDEPDTARSVLDILRIKHPAFYRQVGVSMGGYDAAGDAKKVKCPVLWLMGDEDDLFSDKQIRKIKEYVPHAEFEVVEGGTHAMVYMRGEEIEKRIRDFCVHHCPVEQDTSKARL